MWGAGMLTQVKPAGASATTSARLVAARTDARAAPLVRDTGRAGPVRRATPCSVTSESMISLTNSEDAFHEQRGCLAPTQRARIPNAGLASARDDAISAIFATHPVEP